MTYIIGFLGVTMANCFFRILYFLIAFFRFSRYTDEKRCKSMKKEPEVQDFRLFFKCMILLPAGRTFIMQVDCTDVFERRFFSAHFHVDEISVLSGQYGELAAC